MVRVTARVAQVTEIVTASRANVMTARAKIDRNLTNRKHSLLLFKRHLLLRPFSRLPLLPNPNPFNLSNLNHQ